ncbi:hypothetical protein K438DRAFT_1802954 [Mycena galopus ATCC 62051]|nr:hypothetical protein K438DRAFT_1802954 [Mycena galopus ATCC 62051]
MLFSGIPPEIWATICGEVDELHCLALLCRTSREIQTEAERLLYYSVDLRDHSMRAVQSWARAILKNPHLAERVHALALCLPNTLRFDVSDATKIGHALAKCVNLKELRVIGELDGETGGRQVCMHGWMINDCTFRLIKFENHYFEDRWIMDFWKKQTEIRVLATQNSVCFEDRLLLPKLIAVATHHMSNLGVSAGRALHRIETRFDTRESVLALVQYKGTLTTLNLTRNWVNERFSIADAIATVAELLPSLVHFGINDQRKETSFMCEKTSKKTLQRFSKLETLVLQMVNASFFAVDDATPYAMKEAEGVRGLGYEILMACTTLRRVAVAAEVDQVLSSVQTRSRAGEIHEQSGTDISFEALTMFWKP